MVIVYRSNLVHYVMYFTLCFQGLDLLDFHTNIRFSNMIARKPSLKGYGYGQIVVQWNEYDLKISGQKLIDLANFTNCGKYKMFWIFSQSKNNILGNLNIQTFRTSDQGLD